MTEEQQQRIEELERQIEVLNKRHDIFTESLLKDLDKQIAAFAGYIEELRETDSFTQYLDGFTSYLNCLKQRRAWVQDIQIKWHSLHPGRKDEDK
jgi:hypothetical protein